ncbi:hypothetical protein [Polynucleobacter sp.]|uniref:hypothetical protein n=1 Tax=Polynucleobacter sp. TaxID=2029855 RepID=UPI002736F1EC|nr:hypothetical protein [Polynucleobacter sp.]MDP3121304.1 hypothetical protein [Polynucleobacter sp.]
MTPFIQTYFERKANGALKQSLERACDLSHFKQVKVRLEAGEDLSKELPQLKRLSKKDALVIVKTLIKRCDTDLNDYWTLPKSTEAKLIVAHKSYKGELVPRFTANYQFKTQLGQVEIKVTTQGRYVFVSPSTKDIKKANIELALREVDKQLTLVAFR